MGRLVTVNLIVVRPCVFPMIPPQVNGATQVEMVGKDKTGLPTFPMIPPQVNGATLSHEYTPDEGIGFPMIPPQVNGATRRKSALQRRAAKLLGFQ